MASSDPEDDRLLVPPFSGEGPESSGLSWSQYVATHQPAIVYNNEGPGLLEQIALVRQNSGGVSGQIRLASPDDGELTREKVEALVARLDEIFHQYQHEKAGWFGRAIGTAPRFSITPGEHPHLMDVSADCPETVTHVVSRDRELVAKPETLVKQQPAAGATL